MNRQGVGNRWGKKVYIGLSGGVDSSVSAGLLKKAGFDVHGVFIKTWSPDWLPCTWREERLDAMRVCAHLEIPFTTLDLEKEYKRDVVDYMIREYKAGRTPNPDVMCNKYIKFGGFYDWAMKNGADYVATGHYARIANSVKRTADSKKEKSLNAKRYTLHSGLDKNKDQSYFLWQIKKEQLPHILFPVGQFKKSEVRNLAKEFDLPTAEKKDSQGLCFMGKIDVKEFLRHYIKSGRGKVLNEKGEEIGHHEGAVFLTIGERHGFEITKKTPSDRPYFVLSKNVERNEIVVGHMDKGAVGGVKELSLNGVNFMDEEVFSKATTLKARVRYRQPFQDVRFKIQDSRMGKREMKIEFKEPQIVASGQSVVIYSGDECLGGGIIV